MAARNEVCPVPSRWRDSSLFGSQSAPALQECIPQVLARGAHLVAAILILFDVHRTLITIWKKLRTATRLSPWETFQVSFELLKFRIQRNTRRTPITRPLAINQPVKNEQTTTLFGFHRPYRSFAMVSSLLGSEWAAQGLARPTRTGRSEAQQETGETWIAYVTWFVSRTRRRSSSHALSSQLTLTVYFRSLKWESNIWWHHYVSH